MPYKSLRRAARATAAATAGGVSDLASSVATILRIGLDPIPVRRIPAAEAGRKLLILAPGPSLAGSLQSVSAQTLQQLTLMTVNDSFRDRLFLELRPSLHAIADPAYWYSDSFADHGAPLVQALSKCDWPITLFLPSRARRSVLADALAAASVRLVHYPATAVRGFAWLEYAAFAIQLGMPRAQNVLVAALAIGLWMDFKSIAIVGADHSWHESLTVGADNILRIQQSHSYDEDTTASPFWKPEALSKASRNEPAKSGDVFTMKEIFSAWASVHDSYSRIGRLAKRRGGRIVNCSSVSFIDQFDRVPLADFVESFQP
jgi:hypothetical protein